VNQPDHLQAIHHRHENINDQQIKMIGLDLLESIATIFRNDNFVVFNFKPRFDRRSNRAIVVNNKDAGHGECLTSGEHAPW